jgi:hypothetical protein
LIKNKPAKTHVFFLLGEEQEREREREDGPVFSPEKDSTKTRRGSGHGANETKRNKRKEK